MYVDPVFRKKCESKTASGFPEDIFQMSCCNTQRKKRDFVPRECDILLSWDDFVLAFLLIGSLHPKPAVLKLKKKVNECELLALELLQLAEVKV